MLVAARPRSLVIPMVVVVAAGGCASQLAPCAVQCSEDGACPSGMRCSAADGHCHAGDSEPACTSVDDVDAAIAPGDGGSIDGGSVVPVDCSMLDLVIVVDDSGTMESEQTALGGATATLLSTLDSQRTESGDPLLYRIAVTTTSRDVVYSTPDGSHTDQGADGEFLTHCGGGRWLDVGTPNIDSALSCRVRPGILGSAMEMPAYAIELAFTARVSDGLNAGFRRPGAMLGVIIYSNEDDCSRRDNNFGVLTVDGCPNEPELLTPADVVEVLDDVAGDRSHWGLAVMSGSPSLGCAEGDVTASPAPRFGALVDAAGPRGLHKELCASPGSKLASIASFLLATCQASD